MLPSVRQLAGLRYVDISQGEGYRQAVAAQGGPEVNVPYLELSWQALGAARRCSEAAGPPCFADAAVDTAYPTFLVLDESGRIERISAGWPSGATAAEAVEYYRMCTE